MEMLNNLRSGVLINIRNLFGKWFLKTGLIFCSCRSHLKRFYNTWSSISWFATGIGVKCKCSYLFFYHSQYNQTRLSRFWNEKKDLRIKWKSLSSHDNCSKYCGIGFQIYTKTCALEEIKALKLVRVSICKSHWSL